MKHSFTRQQKLLEADEFSSVFILRKLIRSEYINIYYKKNELGYSRLGLIVSKKIHKRAVRRNYMKRLLREYFRQHQLGTIGFDIVIKVVKYYNSEQYQAMVGELDNLTRRVLKYYNKDNPIATVDLENAK